MSRGFSISDIRGHPNDPTDENEMAPRESQDSVHREPRRPLMELPIQQVEAPVGAFGIGSDLLNDSESTDCITMIPNPNYNSNDGDDNKENEHETEQILQKSIGGVTLGSPERSLRNRTVYKAESLMKQTGTGRKNIAKNDKKKDIKGATGSDNGNANGEGSAKKRNPYGCSVRSVRNSLVKLISARKLLKDETSRQIEEILCSFSMGNIDEKDIVAGFIGRVHRDLVAATEESVGDGNINELGSVKVEPTTSAINEQGQQISETNPGHVTLPDDDIGDSVSFSYLELPGEESQETVHDVNDSISPLAHSSARKKTPKVIPPKRKLCELFSESDTHKPDHFGSVSPRM